MSGAVYTLDAYEVLEKLGEGVYGEVFKCIHKEKGNIVAVKHIKRHEDSASAMLQELTALQALEGLDPDFNLINLNDWFQSKNGDFFMEFEMLDQSVFDLMTKRDSSFSLSEIRPMARDMLVALKGLRTVGVIHTDIKPDNIMLVDHKNKPFKVKLIDFGVAVLKEQVEIGEMLQPAAYRSPEVTLGLPITGAIDMWSLACCLLEWYLQIFPFNVEDSYDSLRQITHLLGVPDGDLIMRAEDGTSYFVREKNGKWRLKTPSEYRDLDGKMPKLDQNFLEAATGLDDAVLNSFEIQSGMEYEDRRAFLDLLRKMLEFDPEKRITPTEALEHPFITLSHFRDRSYVADSEKLLAFTPCYDPIAEEQKPKRQKRFHIDWLSPSIVSSSDAFNSMSLIWSYGDSDSSANSSVQSWHSSCFPISSDSDGPADVCSFTPERIVHVSNWRDICFSNDSPIDSQEVDSETEAEEEEADLEHTGYMATSVYISVDEDFKTQRSSGTYMDESEEDCPTMFQSTHNRCLEPVGNFKVHEAEHGNQATVESQDLKINSPVPPLGVQLPSSNEISNGKSPNEGLRTSKYNISKDEGFENEMARTTLCQGSKVTSPTISPLEYTDIQETEQTLNVCIWVGPPRTERPEEVLAIPETVLGEKFLKTETIADFIPDVMSTSEEVTYTGKDSASLSFEHPIISHNEHEQILKTQSSLPLPKTKVIQTSSGEKGKAAETLQHSHFKPAGEC
ncbi:unnamed protein product [Knipowitschia caucasica]